VTRRGLLLVLAAVVVVAAVVVGLAVNTGGRKPSPPSPPSATGGRGPSGGKLLFADAFAKADWCNFARVQTVHYSDKACGYRNNHYSLAYDPKAGGNGAVRFTVRPGDSIGGGLGSGERAELSQDSAPWQAREGDEWWVQERIKVSARFKPGDGWLILTQFHAGVDSPPLSLQVGGNGALLLASGGNAADVNGRAGLRDRVLVPAKQFMAARGRWFDVDIHVVWSNDPDVGGTEAYVDGSRVAPWRNQQTMTSDRIYFKCGIYRAPSRTTTVLWIDDLRITAR
jgi:hypothetical protein